MKQDTFLIVDDVEVNRYILGEIFKSDFRIIEASNGKEALGIIEMESERLAIILLDIIMPVMNGKETLMSLKKINPELPVIVISGFTTAAAVREILALGAYGFLQKPFKKTEITGILMRIEKEIEIRQKA